MYMRPHIHSSAEMKATFEASSVKTNKCLNIHICYYYCYNA